MSVTCSADKIEWAQEVYEALKRDESEFEKRKIGSYDKLVALCVVLREHSQRIVLTSGSFDILHEGHSIYLEAARKHGDFLVVGVDSDAKIRDRKGPGRPAVPEQERMRMVAHQRGVGAIVLKKHDDPHWALIKAVRPDVLVATQETYTDSQITTLEEHYCGKVVVLPRMATISTSARLRLMQLQYLRGATEEIGKAVTERLTKGLSKVIETEVNDALRDITKEEPK